MTDYLGRMAARSLDQLTSLRPRLRSRFESRPAPARVWGEQELGLELEAERARPAPAPQHQAGAVGTEEAAASSRPGDSGVEIEARIDSVAAAPEDPPPGLPHKGGGSPAFDDITFGILAQPASQREQEEEIGIEWRAPSSFPSPFVGEVGWGGMSEAPRRARPGPARPGRDLESKFERVSVPYRSHPLLASRPGPSLVAASARRPAEQLGYGPERDQGPTVRVSIGRIEVQAPAGPAAAPPPVRRPSPIQSLDSYLEQRRRVRR